MKNLDAMQAGDFAARFATPGWYRFILSNAEGALQQTGIYGELLANPYSIRAGGGR